MSAIQYRVKRLEEKTEEPRRVSLRDYSLPSLKLLAVRIFALDPEERPALEAEFRRRGLSEEEISLALPSA